jgi:hypothetical protein
LGAGAGYGAGGYGISGFNGANGLGAGGAYGVAGLGSAAGVYGATTTLGASAPFGSAFGTGVGTQFGGQQFGTAGNVTTVAGAPIYVPQPYPAYYGVPQLRGVPVAVGGFGGGALPFGLEASIGTSFAAGGNIFSAKEAGPASDGIGGSSSGRTVGAIGDISYGDAFDNAVHYNLAAAYDLNPSTTLIGQVGYASAEGQSVQISNVTEGGTTAPLFGKFSDLEQYTIEGGVRKYLGAPYSALRPYVGGTAGVTYTDDVDLIQTSSVFPAGTDAPIAGFLQGGWQPTASGVVGAEMQVGARSAIGIESGIRWTDNSDSLLPTDDRWSIPLKLRGRVSF